MTQQPGAPAQTVCRACGAELREQVSFCPHCGAAQSGEQAAQRRFSTGALFGIGAVIAVVIGGLSFGITRMVIPEPQQQAQQQQPAQQQEQPVPPELVELRKKMRDSLIADPDNAGLTLRFANLLYDIGEYNSAADFYNRYIVRFDSTNADALVDYGHTLFRVGQHEEAVRMTTRALEVAPNHQAALFNLGVMSVQMQDREAARTWFSKCADADPSSKLGQQARQILTSLSSSN